MSTRKASSAASGKKRILILDDHPMMREGLAQLINSETGLSVCGEAGCGQEAFELAAKLKPDLLLVDISLPDKSGLEVIKELRSFHPDISVLVISMHDESLYAERVLRAGGRGYIMKQEGGKKLMEAILQVLSGKIYVSEKMSEKLLASFSERSNPVKRDSPMENLTDREFEVLQLLGQGKGTREIASQLHLSGKTIEAHRANIKRKLDLKTGPELVRYAVRWVETQKVG
jgi:DNA-binding NarL/FixJ family response regulator